MNNEIALDTNYYKIKYFTGLAATEAKKHEKAIEIFVKYESYISKEQEIADKLSKFEDIPLYDTFDYQKLQSLSYEAREKLTKMKPKTIGQASRISGISPSDISVLIVYLGR